MSLLSASPTCVLVLCITFIFPCFLYHPHIVLVVCISNLCPSSLHHPPASLPRLRRELSGQGKDAFLRGDYPASLQYYNEALMYSSGKGIAHTLAMRAAFFLATDDHALAVR